MAGCPHGMAVYTGSPAPCWASASACVHDIVFVRAYVCTFIVVPAENFYIVKMGEVDIFKQDVNTMQLSLVRKVRFLALQRSGRTANATSITRVVYANTTSSCRAVNPERAR